MMIQYPLKRWLLFVGECYYPLGGSRDLHASFDTQAEAVADLVRRPVDCSGSWANILDQATGASSRWEADGGCAGSWFDKGLPSKPWTRIDPQEQHDEDDGA